MRLDAMELSIDVISGLVPVLYVRTKDGNVSVFVKFCVRCVVACVTCCFSGEVLRCLD